MYTLDTPYSSQVVFLNSENCVYKNVLGHIQSYPQTLRWTYGLSPFQKQNGQYSRAYKNRPYP